MPLIFNYGSYSECGTLKIGVSNDCVCKIQKILNQLGFKVPITGFFDAKTADGIVNYQKISGLKPDGIVGKNTWESLLYMYKQSGGKELTSPYCPSGIKVPKPITEDMVKKVLPLVLIGSGMAIIMYMFFMEEK